MNKVTCDMGSGKKKEKEKKARQLTEADLTTFRFLFTSETQLYPLS